MAITKDSSVQEVLSKLVTINFGDLAGTSGTDVAAIDIPQGAIVVSGAIVKRIVFNSATSDTLSVGDSGSATRYLGATDVKTATGIVALVPTGYIHANPAITVRWTGVGAVPTTGQVQLRVDYVTPGRADSTYQY
jgi:hypothetical protein